MEVLAYKTAHSAVQSRLSKLKTWCFKGNYQENEKKAHGKGENTC